MSCMPAGGLSTRPVEIAVRLVRVAVGSGTVCGRGFITTSYGQTWQPQTCGSTIDVGAFPGAEGSEALYATALGF
jgi:hypothetical protein